MSTCETCPFSDRRPRLLRSSALECRYWPNPQPKREDDWCAQHPARERKDEPFVPCRDELAESAMQGILASLPTAYNHATMPFGDSAHAFAAQAYEIADAMLAARASSTTPEKP
jgi:hypothetical protein